MDKISVVIPVFNGEKCLNQCIDSVLNQDYSDFELIIINDGSTDNTAGILEEYAEKDSRIKIITQANRGLAETRNIGLAAIKSDWFTFVDADDWLEPDYLSYLLEIQKQTGKDCIAANHLVEVGNQSYPRFKQLSGIHVIAQNEALENILYHEEPDVSAWGKLFHVRLFEGVKYPTGKVFEDTYTISQIICNSNGVGMGYKPVYHYRFSKDSLSKKTTSAHYFDFINAVDRMIECMPDEVKSLEDGVIRRKVHAALSTLRLGCIDAKPSSAECIKYIRKNAAVVLKNERVGKRDKIGVILACCGKTCFDYAWRVYSIFRKEY